MESCVSFEMICFFDNVLVGLCILCLFDYANLFCRWGISYVVHHHFCASELDDICALLIRLGSMIHVIFYVCFLSYTANDEIRYHTDYTSRKSGTTGSCSFAKSPSHISPIPVSISPCTIRLGSNDRDCGATSSARGPSMHQV